MQGEEFHSLTWVFDPGFLWCNLVSGTEGYAIGASQPISGNDHPFSHQSQGSSERERAASESPKA